MIAISKDQCRTTTSWTTRHMEQQTAVSTVGPSVVLTLTSNLQQRQQPTYSDASTVSREFYYCKKRMSESTNTSRQPIANRLWLLNKPARRAVRASSVTRRNLDNVRRNLEAQYSSDSETELPSNVVNKRDFPFTSFEASLFAHETQHENRQTRQDVSKTPSRVSLRRKFSLTSYKSDIFDEIYTQAGNMSTPLHNTAANIPVTAVDDKTNRLRQTISQIEQDRTPRSEEIKNNLQLLDILKEIHAKVNSLNRRITQLENANTRAHQHVYNRPEDAYNVIYEQTERDIRNRRNTTSPNFLSLKEARKMIPEFNGTSQSRLREFLNISTYAIQNINPAEEESLVQAILCLKLKGKALQDFQMRDIRTFEELKQRLKTYYQASKESTAHLQLKFNSLKQKISESAQTFGRRVNKLAMTLYESMTEDENYSAAEKRVILQTVQKQALLNFQIIRRRLEDIRPLTAIRDPSRSDNQRERRRKAYCNATT